MANHVKRDWLLYTILGAVIFVLAGQIGQYFRDPVESAILNQRVRSNTAYTERHSEKHEREAVPERIAALTANMERMTTLMERMVRFQKGMVEEKEKIRTVPINGDSKPK